MKWLKLVKAPLMSSLMCRRHELFSKKEMAKNPKNRRKYLKLKSLVHITSDLQNDLKNFIDIFRTLNITKKTEICPFCRR